MPGFDNPYAELREKSKGEWDQEWSQLFIMASLLFGVSFTEREKAAIPVLVGAFRREFKNFNWEKLLKLASEKLPDVPPE